MKLCAVSIDIDEMSNYFDIHGIARAAEGAHAAYDVALPRAAAFADAHRLPFTLFAVGEDLERPENAATIRSLAAKGHAIENHTYGHRYDLTRLTKAEICAEIERGAAIIAGAAGERPTGFRAPGYTVNDVVFDALEEVGVAYDSSVFPCPPYYLAKAAVLLAMRLRGRTSRSILDTPRVIAAPRSPYTPGESWDRPSRPGGRARRFLELPIQVTPWVRLPVIGTSVELAGAWGAAALAKLCAGDALVNLELHAIDFLDGSDGIEALVPHQRELGLPLRARLDALSAALEALGRAGFSFVRLGEAAARLR